MGLYDRDYMQDAKRPPENAGRMLMGIIIINIIIFLFDAHTSLAFIYDGKINAANLLQFVTSGFTHSDWWHFFFNMWALYLFGSLVTPHMNGGKFLGLYLSGVIVGNAIYVACNLNSDPFKLMGASGAVFAIMTAAATVEPERRFMMLFFPAPVKTTTLVIVYTLLEILFAINFQTGNIAHLAHIGGVIGGYIMMKIYFGNNLTWDPLRFKRTPVNTGYTTAEPEKPEPFTPGAPETPVSQKELDYLLDKLSHDGINSLSEAELERLRQARRQMRGE